MGKKITFAAFLLALACLVPTGIFALLDGRESIPLYLGLITVIGFPLFALISFIGMIIWTLTEIRNSGPHQSGRDD